MLTKAKKSLLVSLSALLCVMLLAFGLSATSIFARKTAKADGETKYVAQIGDVNYETLADAFDNVKTGDTVKLIADIKLTEQINIVKALDGLTLDGNGHTIDCATTTDVFASGGSALYFGNADSKLYCTGIKIKNLTMTGKARFAIFLCGGTTTEFTNVNISGDYYMGVNLYGTHGATMTDCNISNNTTGTDEYICAVWSNVASANPLKLVNSKVSVITINAYTTANTLAPKIFIDKDSSAVVHTFDDGSVSGDKKLCVSKDSEGNYSILEFDESNNSWVGVVNPVAQINATYYATLNAAIAAAKDGDTVKLLADVNENITVAAGKNLTLDLNGFTVDGGTGTAVATVYNCGVLTITDSGKGGTIKRDDKGSVGETSYYVIKNHGIMTIKKAIVINNSGYKEQNSSGSMVGSSLICNGGVDTVSTLTVEGGEFRQDNFIAIKNDANGELYVKGGTITSNHSTVQNWFKAELTGGVIRGQLWTDAYKEGESVGNTVIDGNVDYEGEIVMDITGSVKPTLEIKGGILNVTNWEITSKCARAGGRPFVSGGTFTSKIPLGYCAEFYRPAKNTDGTYTSKYRIVAATQVELGKDIAFKYYIDSDAAKYNGTVAKVVVSYSGKEGGIVSKELAVKKDSSGSYYLFDGITPQMIDRSFAVTAVYDGYEVEDIDDDSVLKYLRSCLNSGKSKYTEIIANLANYCKAAAAYVGYDDTVDAIDHLISIYKLSTYVKTGDFAESDCVAENSGEKIVNVAVKFDCQNKILVGIADDKFNENYIVKVNGNIITEWDMTISEGYRVYDVGGVNAVYIADSAKYITIEVFEKGNEKAIQTVKYNVAGYCKAIYGGDNEKLKPLAQATYYYGLAAKEFANQSANA